MKSKCVFHLGLRTTGLQLIVNSRIQFSVSCSSSYLSICILHSTFINKYDRRKKAILNEIVNFVDGGLVRLSEEPPF